MILLPWPVTASFATLLCNISCQEAWHISTASGLALWLGLANRKRQSDKPHRALRALLSGHFPVNKPRPACWRTRLPSSPLPTASLSIMNRAYPWAAKLTWPTSWLYMQECPHWRSATHLAPISSPTHSLMKDNGWLFAATKFWVVHCATVDNHTMAVLFWPAEHELMFTVVSWKS